MVASTPRPSLALRGLAFGAAALMLFSACSSSSGSPSAAAGASARPHRPCPPNTPRARLPPAVSARHDPSNEHPRRCRAPPSRRWSTTAPNKTGVQATVNTTSIHSTSRTSSTRTCRARRMTSSSGSPGTMRLLRRAGPADADRRRLGRPSARTTRTHGQGIPGRRRQEVRRADRTTTRGSSSTARASSGEGLHRPEDVGRVRDPGQEDPGRRPHPARLRRQGRLAGDGHVRHPQHAHERVPVPCRPAGRQAEVDGSQGPGGLREVGGAPALHPARPARPDLAGRRPDAGPATRRRCTSWARSRPSR